MLMCKKKKVALVFTGAVSLGSFEAGVAYELVKYIRERNDCELDIDVIVGSSAGALTGALTALSLVFGTDPEVLRQAWTSVKLEDLMKLKPGDRSLLSSSKVGELIAGYIGPPQKGTAKYPVWDKGVNLVVVATNLDGIKYRIHRASDPEFSISAIGYEDTFKFQIEPGFSEWGRLKDAVQASSAYPVAFEHKSIRRGNNEYWRLARYNFIEREERAFHYSDGGIVNNQPLNKAVEVVSELPYSCPENGSKRIFLVIDPSPPLEEAEGRKDYGIYDVVSKALWTIPRNQTLYKDLLLLEKVNRRLRWKNSFISAMADILNNCTISPDEVCRLKELCRDIALFKGQKMHGVTPDNYLETEERRIRNLYKNEIGRAKNDDFFIKYCFLLDQVADLRNKQEISVEMIKPLNPDKELAGVIYGNFGGFLDTNFMRHDFYVGQTYARRWLDKDGDLHSLIHCTKKTVSPLVRWKFFQKVFDNSIPVLVEDIAPRLLSLDRDLPKQFAGVFIFLKMFVVSVGKYAVKKSIGWTREKLH